MRKNYKKRDAPLIVIILCLIILYLIIKIYDIHILSVLTGLILLSNKQAKEFSEASDFLNPEWSYNLMIELTNEINLLTWLSILIWAFIYSLISFSLFLIAFFINIYYLCLICAILAPKEVIIVIFITLVLFWLYLTKDDDDT